MVIVPPPVEPGYVEVIRLDPTAAIPTVARWLVSALAPTGRDAATGDKPVKICFQKGGVPKPDCTAITSSLDNGGITYNYQSLGGENGLVADGLKIETLAPGVKGIVAKATFSGGGSGSVTQTVIWTYSGGLTGSFFPVFTSRIDNLGEDRRFASGAMAGYYITADFVWGEHETHWDPHRFTIDAYKLAPSGGYLRVISYVTTAKYPAERETADYVINHELLHLKRVLTAAYPKGLSF